MPPKQEKVDWNAVPTWERLMAAVIASGVKLDLKTIATYYGTSYSTLENRFRKVKTAAEGLKAEQGEEAVLASPTKATPKKPKTPKKEAGDTVANGRVSKKTPMKGSGKKPSIKKEHNGDDDELASSSDRDAPHVDDEDVFT